MSKGNEIVSLALSQLGTRGADAKKYCGLPSSANYCDAFVTWLFYKKGAKKLYCNGTKQVNCPTSIKWCYKNLANIPPYLAMAGDVIFFDWEPNAIPNHVGIVREPKSAVDIYTVEGNTSNDKGKTGVVAKKTRTVYNKTKTKKYVMAIFRPHYPASFKNAKLNIDGVCGYSTIAMLQRALKTKGTYTGAVDGILGRSTVKGIQKLVKVTADGSWGDGTTKAFQKYLGIAQDGLWGPDSTKAMQKWINKINAK